MIFNDQSGSMSGAPFDGVKAACEAIADMVFTDTESCPEDNQFEMVHTVFFESYSSMTSTNKKSEYLQRIRNERIKGGTAFDPCFNDILSKAEKCPNGSEFFILFLTDGQGGYAKLDFMKARLKALASEK